MMSDGSKIEKFYLQTNHHPQSLTKKLENITNIRNTTPLNVILLTVVPERPVQCPKSCGTQAGDLETPPGIIGGRLRR